MSASLKKLVGSLLIVGFEGPRVTESLQNFLEQWDLGGVILFKRNIESLEQLTQLNETIYRLAQKPPILSVDHEGGRVFRLPSPFTAFPPMQKLGTLCAKQKNDVSAEQVGKVFARELRAVGFNVDYAPVLDVHTQPQNPIIGDRAFSEDPQQVGQVAMGFLRGLQSEGVLGCGKHFPGHGDTSEDSHLTLPVVNKSLDELRRCEFIPFQAAIQQEIPLLMTAHVMYPQIDAQWPATLSEKILTEILRNELGFQGLVISDDLFMKGITLQWKVEEAAERFLRAGGDLILLCHQEAVQRRVAAALVHQAEKDEEFHKLIIAKAEKVAAFRKRLAVGVVSDDLGKIGCEGHQKISQMLT